MLHNVDLGNAQNPLYRDLRKLLEIVVGPVEAAIARYAAVKVYALTYLEPEFVYLLNAVALSRRLRAAGLQICFPEIAPPEERVTQVEAGFNVGLAVRTIAAHLKQSRPPSDGPPGTPARDLLPTVEAGSDVVPNTIDFAETARIWILTGPNRGGKTTYTRSVGQAHVLFQAGLFVPGEAARISPTDGLYTHFATQESAALGMGRLDEEAARLAHIFERASAHSLILLNEVLAGTSTIEALGLAVDAVRGLRLLGGRAIYTTHLHELAARVDEINAATPGEALVGSLVATVDEQDGVGPAAGDAGQPGRQSEAARPVIGPRHRRTYHIVPSPPRNVSYASEIAEQHGISFPQLVHLFGKRGVLPAGAGL